MNRFALYPERVQIHFCQISIEIGTKSFWGHKTYKKKKKKPFVSCNKKLS